MPAVTQIPFRSEYGFISNGFSVDSLGNLVVRSITETGGGTTSEDVLADFTVTYGIGWKILPTGDGNPTITLSRSSSYIFELSELITGFYIANADGGELYNNGLLHTDNSSGEDAQGKTSGRLIFSVPSNAPDFLSYKNQTGTETGVIEIINPVGVFDTVEIFNDQTSTDITTGSLVVYGGIGVAKDIHIGGDTIHVDDSVLTINNISSNSNNVSVLTINGAGGIEVKVGNTTVGVINSLGSTIPINNSTINNTIIGGNTPSSATFTSASVQNKPVEAQGVANKDYVDSTSLTLAVAFGL